MKSSSKILVRLVAGVLAVIQSVGLFAIVYHEGVESLEIGMAIGVTIIIFIYIALKGVSLFAVAKKNDITKS